MRTIAAVSVSLLILCSLLSHAAASDPLSRALQATEKVVDGALGGIPADTSARFPVHRVLQTSEGPEASKSLYQAHGWLMWIGFGLLLPIGIITSRHMKTVTGSWFRVHIACMTLGMLCILVAAIIALAKFDGIPVRSRQSEVSRVHVSFGLAIVILAVINYLLGAVRPHRGTTTRVGWYFSHFTLGTCVVIFAWYNIFTGMEAYEEIWGSNLKVEQILFAILVAILAYIYLFLGRWDHMMNQRENSGVEIDGIRKLAPTHHAGTPTAV